MTVFGIHTNAQNKPLEDLVSVWRHADALGYGWISISDHFPGSLGPTSNEAVVAQTVMAASTTRATCGVLVYSVGFRHPAVLATAVTTLDHFSGGRAAIGLGAGSVPKDYELYGFELPPIGQRMDMLDEAVRCVTGLLREEVTDFEGRYYSLRRAGNRPRPVQERLPVWLGTTGERRGLRIAAQHADGWNVGFLTVDQFAHKRAVLHEHCDTVGRDPREVRCSVNLSLAVDGTADSLPEQSRASALVGSVDEIVERIGRYVEAGADQINFHLPYPWDYDGLGTLAAALGLPAA